MGQSPTAPYCRAPPVCKTLCYSNSNPPSSPFQQGFLSPLYRWGNRGSEGFIWPAGASLEDRPIWFPAACPVQASKVSPLIHSLAVNPFSWLQLPDLYTPRFALRARAHPWLHVCTRYPSGTLLLQITYMPWCMCECDDCQVNRPPARLWNSIPITQSNRHRGVPSHLSPSFFMSCFVPSLCLLEADDILWRQCAFDKSNFTLCLNKQCAHSVRCVQDTAGGTLLSVSLASMFFSSLKTC